jgi:hypothetical protein
MEAERGDDYHNLWINPKSPCLPMDDGLPNASDLWKIISCETDPADRCVVVAFISPIRTSPVVPCSRNAIRHFSKSGRGFLRGMPTIKASSTLQVDLRDFAGIAGASVSETLFVVSG